MIHFCTFSNYPENP